MDKISQIGTSPSEIKETLKPLKLSDSETKDVSEHIGRMKTISGKQRFLYMLTLKPAPLWNSADDEEAMKACRMGDMIEFNRTGKILTYQVRASESCIV